MTVEILGVLIPLWIGFYFWFKSERDAKEKEKKRLFWEQHNRDRLRRMRANNKC